MKKRFWLVLLPVCMVMALAAGCSKKNSSDTPPEDDPPVTDPTEIPAESVTFEKDAVSVKAGETVTLKASVLPEHTTDKLQWTSSAPAVASVSGGVVTAHRIGTAKITAKAGKVSAVCTVTVTSDEVKKTNYLYYEDFERTALPAYLTYSMAGGGRIALSDGGIALTTDGAGTAMAEYAFTESLTGPIVAEAKVKITTDSGAFSNLLFFYTAEKEPVLTFAANGGGFRNHSGAGWSGSIVPHAVGEWQQVRLLLDPAAGTYDFYLDGAFVQTCNYRNKALANDIAYLSFGSDKENAGMILDDIHIYSAEDMLFPTIETERTSYRVTPGSSVEFDYTVDGNPAPTVTLTCDKTGVTIGADNKTVTFDAGAETGSYVFKLRAENEFGVSEATFTVLVTSDMNTLLDTDFTELPAGMTVVDEKLGSVKVEDGYLTIETDEDADPQTPHVLVGYDFGEPLSGKVLAELRVKNDSSYERHFLNVMFLYDASATSNTMNLNTAALAFEKQAEGTVTFQYNYNGWKQSTVACPTGEWLDLSILYDFENAKMSVWSGETLVFDEVPFRYDTYKATTQKIFIGSTEKGVKFSYDSMKFRKVTGPSLEIGTPSGTVDLDTGNGEYTLDYTATSTTTGIAAPTVTVTCDRESGFEWQQEGKVVKFTAAGTYTFTVTARDMTGSASDTITVEVTGKVEAPTLTLTSDKAKTLSLQSEDGAKYTFAYTVKGSPAPDVQLSCTREDYFYDEASKTASFFSAGEYVFTVTATNSAGTVSETVTITVTDRYAAPSQVKGEKILWNETFDGAQKPDGITESKEVSGNVEYADGKMRLTTGSASGSKVFVNHEFAANLEGIIVIEQQISLNSDAFHNIMFLQRNAADSGTAIACFAIESMIIRYHNGSGWNRVPYGDYNVQLEKNVTYTLRTVNDMTAQVTYLYLAGASVTLLNGEGSVVAPQTLEGEIYLGAYPFRVKDTAVKALRMGFDKTNGDLSVDSVRVYTLFPTLTVNETEKTIENFGGSAQYTLDYTAEEGAEVEISCDQTDGWVCEDKKTVTFTAAGKYVFTVKVQNDYGSIQKTVTVTVLEDTVPDTETLFESADLAKGEDESITVTQTGDGASLTTGADGATFKTGTTNGTVTFRKKFAAPFSGIVETEISFRINEKLQNSFNLLFFFKDGNTTAATNFMVGMDGTIQYRGGTGYYKDSWKGIPYEGRVVTAQVGEWWTLRAVCDFTNKMCYAYVMREGGNTHGIEGATWLYLGEFEFRTPDIEADVVSTGIDNKKGMDVTVRNLKVTQYNIPYIAGVVEDATYSLKLEKEDAKFDLLAVPLGGTFSDLRCDAQDGWSRAENELTFTKQGTYKFTYEAANGTGTATRTFTVVVEESRVPETVVLYHSDFAEKPTDENIEIVSEASGVTEEDKYLNFADGHLHIDVAEKGAGRFRVDFGETQHGILLTEIKFRLENDGFANLCFFYEADKNTPSQTIAAETRRLRYNNGGWKTVQYEGGDFCFVLNAWYTLTVYHDFDNEVSYIFVSGENYQQGTNGDTKPLGENIYLGQFAFRNKGKSTSVFAVESNNKAVFSVDELTITKCNGVVLFADKAELTATLSEGTAEADLGYHIYGNAAEPQITCDKESGWSADGQKITFTEAGVYTFTITSESYYGQKTATVKVTVAEA